ncbi:uncharacterized protein LOC114447117 isoform X1 [Parambassis ranga]|uniref:Uncharacterized protein LOC114447117 isoform X1 n=1 Tax=Parambassis ranga TaxID=210632 RepID=A0A6P7JPT8_9TELE|nr:uncharacterized protein LOC114447117 isoform X1 [Parambassis ranga]
MVEQLASIMENLLLTAVTEICSEVRLKPENSKMEEELLAVLRRLCDTLLQEADGGCSRRGGGRSEEAAGEQETRRPQEERRPQDGRRRGGLQESESRQPINMLPCPTHSEQAAAADSGLAAAVEVPPTGSLPQQTAAFSAVPSVAEGSQPAAAARSTADRPPPQRRTPALTVGNGLHATPSRRTRLLAAGRSHVRPVERRWWRRAASKDTD